MCGAQALHGVYYFETPFYLLHLLGNLLLHCVLSVQNLLFLFLQEILD